MSQLLKGSTRADSGRPIPDEAVLPDPQRQGSTLPRIVGALAVLVVGAVHLQQYIGVHIDNVAVIGPLFLLNFVGATVIGLGLLVPSVRLRVLQPLLALGGIGLAATSIVFLFISEHQPLFGFQEHGYRLAIVVALASEAVTVVALGAYVATWVRGRS